MVMPRQNETGNRIPDRFAKVRQIQVNQMVFRNNFGHRPENRHKVFFLSLIYTLKLCRVAFVSFMAIDKCVDQCGEPNGLMPILEENIREAQNTHY